MAYTVVYTTISERSCEQLRESSRLFVERFSYSSAITFTFRELETHIQYFTVGTVG